MSQETQMKAEQIAGKVGDVFTEEELEIEVVLSVLVSMLVSTAMGQAGMSGLQLVRLFSQAVEKYEEATNQEREEEYEQVISGTTH
jgi:hypothetical protein